MCNQTTDLPQRLVLSMVHFLATDLVTNAPMKLQYLQEAAMAIKPKDPDCVQFMARLAKGENVLEGKEIILFRSPFSGCLVLVFFAHFSFLALPFFFFLSPLSFFCFLLHVF